MLNLIRELHTDWTETLLSTQIMDPDNQAEHGALYCRTCGIIHGRCQETMTAFLERASQTEDPRYIAAAEKVFAWADRNLTQSDGSFRNDTDSNWLGTTVFNVIQILDALKDYDDLISADTYAYWHRRTLSAAYFLIDFTVIETTVINYAIGNTYAMWRCWDFFKDRRFFDRYLQLKTYILKFISVSDLIFGEGANKERISAKGGKPVDIGYNLEESLPLLTRLAIESHDEELIDLCRRLTLSHSDWVLNDGIVDNSFGTRNYKWTLWGSRTTDGLHLPFLVFADSNDSLGAKALANLKLLRKCTHDGYLYGGLHNQQIGEGPCLHHTMTHVKALVTLLRTPYLERVLRVQEKKHLLNDMNDIDDMNQQNEQLKVRYFSELDTFRIHHPPYTSTLTAYDWHYVHGGHISGGSLSLLHHQNYGLMTASSMNSYHRQEINNMQDPTCPNHANLSPRLVRRVPDSESGVETVYSSAYDHDAFLKRINDRTFIAKGYLKDLDGQLPPGSLEDNAYEFRYSFDAAGVEFQGKCKQGHFILSLIAAPTSMIEENENEVFIQEDKAILKVSLNQGHFDLSQHRRIFNHVPGLAGYETHIFPHDGSFSFVISVIEKCL